MVSLDKTHNESLRSCIVRENNSQMEIYILINILLFKWKILVQKVSITVALSSVTETIEIAQEAILNQHMT